MSVYRVRSASVYRGHGLLGVELESSDGGAGDEYEVVSQPQKRVKVTVTRIVFEDDGSVSSRLIMVIDPPEFPITDLIGERISN